MVDSSRSLDGEQSRCVDDSVEEVSSIEVARPVAPSRVRQLRGSSAVDASREQTFSHFSTKSRSVGRFFPPSGRAKSTDSTEREKLMKQNDDGWQQASKGRQSTRSVSIVSESESAASQKQAKAALLLVCASQ